MIRSDTGAAADIKAPSDLETYFIHAAAATATRDLRITWPGVSHVTANKRKKAKRKQAQTSRRKNRGL